MYRPGTAYREASLGETTHIGLLTLVYEALATDLRQAGQASKDGKIQQRCEASNHALLLIGHLETWTDDLDDPPLAKSLTQLYSFLRRQIIGLQSTGGQEGFEDLSSLILEVRSTWQTKRHQVSHPIGDVRAIAGDEEAPSHTGWLA